MDIEVLRAELLTDPLGRGYAGMTDAQAAASLNAVNRTPARGVVDSYLVVNATVATEWTALSAAEKQRYQTIVGAGKVDNGNANVQAAFLAMFAGGTTTRTNLIALAGGPSISRAAELGLPFVGAHHVAEARR